jgi:tRNA (guanine-N7-)-methyltransferase
MRLRNVKGATEIINNSKYIISDYTNYKGQFSTLFGNNNPIHIEIGMGKGDFLIGNAKQYPDINFIGIEKYDSVMARAVQKLAAEDLNNLKLISMDASAINEIFAHEIDVIYLNFSDPWPKARHESRRLTSAAFLERYEEMFVGEKRIIMKTDNRSLFEFSLESFQAAEYLVDEVTFDLYNEYVSDNIPTEYENKFKDNGPIYKVNVYKK